jgi:malate dehydrogenase (oxaloacetate-decarboxylating)
VGLLTAEYLSMIDIQETRDERTGQKVLAVPLQGLLLLECPLLNKGSAFSDQERREFNLLGLLPAGVSTLEDQVARRYEEYQQKTSDLDRFIFLRALQDRNETLFYALLRQHLAEMLPIIYTPEVGDICQRYSHIFRRPRGLFFSYPQRQEINAILENRPYRQVDVIVVTDGERILGLGDQGVGGMGIPVGKLALYTLCGGIDPGKTLPIMLDVGTNNPERLADPHYLGWRHERVTGQQYDDFIEDFVQAVERHLPSVLLQWEDFSQANARRLLDRYHDRLCSFNDDIQGTAAVTLAALMSAVRMTGGRLRDQRFVFMGAGSAGTGISDLLVKALMQEGLADSEARSLLWLLNSRGVVHSGISDLSPWQQRYSQPKERVAGWQRDHTGNISLIEVVNHVHPTVLIGVCGQRGAFAEAVVRLMARYVERPIIFPLSNPTSRSEAMPADLVAWTEGRTLIATGSPMSSVNYQGRSIPISQCNNSYIFPGLGLAVIAAGARRVTDELFLVAARVLSDCVSASERAEGQLLPSVEDIPKVSRRIALAAGQGAQCLGLARQMTPQEWEQVLDARRWEPSYRPMRFRA